VNFRLVIAFLFLVVPTAFAQAFASGHQPSSGGLSSSEVIQKEGVVVSLTRLKSGKVRMKIQELTESDQQKEKAESQTYTLDWRTMVYKLTERNRQIFKERDKLDEIVDDVNKLHRRLKDLPEKESTLLASYRGSVYVHSSGYVSVDESNLRASRKRLRPPGS